MKAIKRRSSKSQKLDIFPKVLVQKWPFFQHFFLGNIGQENVFYDILERKNAFLGHKNKKFKKSKNWHFFKGVNPWFWSKNGNFSNIFFKGNIDQENVFYDIVERKNDFLSYKNKKFKKPENWHFSKEVIPWFLCKNDHFSTFSFLGYLGRENAFQNILEQKNVVLGYKNKTFKKSKNRHFFKGVNPWFWSKNGHFSNFFLRQYRLGKGVLRYSSAKNASLGYKNKKFKKSKNCHFSKRVNICFR